MKPKARTRCLSSSFILVLAKRASHAILPPPMNVIITLLTIFEVIVCLLLSLLVLMQRPRQEGLGAAFGSGVTDQMFGAQTTNVLQKATVYFGIALFGLTFLLAILVSRQDDRANGKATFVEPSDQVAKPTAGKDGAAPGSPEEMIQKAIDEQMSKHAGEAKDSATPTPAPTPEAPAAQPTTPAPAPAPANSDPAPAPTPPPAVPAPGK